MVELVRCLGTERCGVCGELYSEPPTKTGCYLADHIEAWEALQKAGRYSPLATDLTAREVSSQRMEAARDFH